MVATSPNHRRSGLGRLLYERFFEDARARGARRVGAVTWPGNRVSVGFHRAMGFVPSTGAVAVGSTVTFTNTRTAAPDEGDLSQLGSPDLKVASFNVLNYFTDLGDADPSCTAYYDRDNSGDTVRDGCDNRGAWDAADLARQTEKEVSAINGLDADVVHEVERIDDVAGRLAHLFSARQQPPPGRGARGPRR